MKPSRILLFLTILVLSGLLLRAAGNSRKFVRIEKIEKESVSMEVKDMPLIPNILIL